MNHDQGAFGALFREACRKCFGHAVTEPLTETDARLFYNKVFEETGLVIGWKSLKNYSFFLFSESPGKQENPSVATLDTLARYLAEAPYTTEPERKKEAGHFPYWYAYREKYASSSLNVVGAASPRSSSSVTSRLPPAAAPIARGAAPAAPPKKFPLPAKITVAILLTAFTLVFAYLIRDFFVDPHYPWYKVNEDFHALGEDSLGRHGWNLLAEDTSNWQKRAEQPGCLTLYTLKGDNWPDPAHPPIIHNLLQHELPCKCFTVEVQLKDFVPRQDWQQAGIILSQDTGLASTSMRVSILYNDYNGPYPRSGAIVLQAIVCAGAGKPEEIAHVPLITADTLAKDPGLARSFASAAIRIEKRGDRFRILYADGILATTSFKEIAVHDFDMRPHYVGLFAIKGYVDSSEVIPARFSSFRLQCEACK